MKKILSGIAIILLLTLYLPSSSPGAKKNRERIDWTGGSIISYGSSRVKINSNGEPVDSHEGRPVSLNSARKFCYERAKDAALINLILQIKKIQVDSRTSFRQLLREDRAALTRLSEYIEKNIKLTQYPLDFFTSGCRIEMKMSMLLAALPYTYPEDPIPVIYNNPIPTEYSSLIVDTRKLNIRPMLLPSIYNEEGLEIFGRYFIDIDQVSKSGTVKYVFTDTAAMKNRTAGSNPYFAVAIKSRSGSPVLSHRDVRKILSSPETRKNLRNCRVIFIIDRERK
jgi:hypothetical protein